jgi:hypothetical protein
VGVYRWPISERIGDCLQHAGAIFENIVVPEAEDPPAFRPQSRVSPVMVTRLSVLAAIGFNDEARFETRKIDNVRRYRKLTAKAPAKAVTAQFAPQRLLGVGHISAQVTRLISLREPTAHVLAA